MDYIISMGTRYIGYHGTVCMRGSEPVTFSIRTHALYKSKIDPNCVVFVAIMPVPDLTRTTTPRIELVGATHHHVAKTWTNTFEVANSQTAATACLDHCARGQMLAIREYIERLGDYERYGAMLIGCDDDHLVDIGSDVVGQCVRADDHDEIHHFRPRLDRDIADVVLYDMPLSTTPPAIAMSLAAHLSPDTLIKSQEIGGVVIGNNLFDDPFVFQTTPMIVKMHLRIRDAAVQPVNSPIRMYEPFLVIDSITFTK